MNEMKLDQINEELKKNCPEKDQYYFGHGKLLLTGEYLVLEGANALAIPTKLGQSLSVKYRQSYSPLLHWKSFDVHGNCWFDHKFEFWHFKCLSEKPTEEALFIQKLLQTVRKQNPHFLRDNVDVQVETRLGFPLEWGLGSSSTLIYNVAQWAYVSPFELLFKTHGGSGYDIACAQSELPILYKKQGANPHWSPIQFNPSFKNNLFFVYLGKKRNTRDAIKDFSKRKSFDAKIISEISELTQKMVNTHSLAEFQNIMNEHEAIIADVLNDKPIKEKSFADFNGSLKSLGAWGGDFMLAATTEPLEKVRAYFAKKDLKIVLQFDDLTSFPDVAINHENIKIDSNHLLH